MKRCNEPIRVQCRDGLPWRILRARRLLRVRGAGVVQPVLCVADQQHIDGKWWLSGRLRPRSRRTYLIETHGGTGPVRMEIYVEQGAWRLAAIQD